MQTFSLLRVILNSLRNLLQYKVFFIICERLNKSVFIMNVVTVFYLFTFEVINPLKRRMVYPYKLFWLLILSAKEAFVAIFNLSSPPNLNLNMRVLSK